MKAILFSVLLLLLALKTYSQGKDYFSTEFDASYNYYFTGNNNSNKFNYGFSLLISKYIHRLKLSTGINYSKKSYYSNEDLSNSISKREYNLEYLSIPVIANIKLISQKKICISALLGFAFNHIADYYIKTHYFNGEVITDGKLLKDKSLGLTITFGTSLSKAVSKKFLFSTTPFINYKLIPDHKDQRPNYKNIPDDKLSVGIKISVEYLFKNFDNE